jgi:hypothetical protein
MSPDPGVPITPAASAANEALAIIADVAQAATTPPPVPSTSGSSAGFTLALWWAKNKGRMKSAVMLFAGVITAALAAIHLTMTGPWAILVQGLIGVASLCVALLAGFACDWIDYRYTNNPK